MPELQRVRLLPEVFEDEDGERWWAFGHLDPFAFVLGVTAELLDLCNTLDELPFVAQMLEGVKHDWFRPSDTDEDMNLPCGEHDEGAEPFTWLDLNAARLPIRPASADPDFGLGIPGFSVRFREHRPSGDR